MREAPGRQAEALTDAILKCPGVPATWKAIQERSTLNATKPPRETFIDSILRFGVALLGALLIGFASGFALLAFAPCSWFGSSFEGACGYGAFSFAVLLGLVVFAISFALLLWFGLRHKLGVPPVPDNAPPSNLYRAWLTLLCLQYLAPLLLAFVPEAGMFFTASSVLLLAAFIVASALLARYRARHPAASFFALVPLVGPLIVGALLLKPKPPVPSSGASQVAPSD